MPPVCRMPPRHRQVIARLIQGRYCALFRHRSILSTSSVVPLHSFSYSLHDASTGAFSINALKPWLVHLSNFVGVWWQHLHVDTEGPDPLISIRSSNSNVSTFRLFVSPNTRGFGHLWGLMPCYSSIRNQGLARVVLFGSPLSDVPKLHSGKPPVARYA